MSNSKSSLLRVVVLVAVGLSGGGHGRGLRHLVGVDCHHAGSGLVGRHDAQERVRTSFEQKSVEGWGVCGGLGER